MMTRSSKILAGLILIFVPAITFLGTRLLAMLISNPEYTANPLRQDLWRAGHAHGAVFLIFSLVALRYIDEANLSDHLRWAVRLAFPAAAILMPLAFFLSMASPQATAPNNLIYLAYAAAVALGFGTLTLGVGLMRARE
jgi:hypothetical protein